MFEHEFVVPTQGFPFKLFLFEGKNGGYFREKHWHRSVEIFAVFEGSLTFYLNEQPRQLHAGECILINSNEVHSISALSPNRTLVLQNPVSCFEEHASGGFILFSNNCPARDRQIMELMTQMYAQISEQPVGYRQKTQSDFFLLLYLLISHYQKSAVSPEAVFRYQKMELLSRVTSYLEDNYRSELSLSQAAQQFGYSPAYLSRIFHLYTNTTFVHCLQNIRLEHAVQELVNTDAPLCEIAVNNGFVSARAFRKIFLKKFSVLPGEYRKRQKSAVNRAKNRRD